MSGTFEPIGYSQRSLAEKLGIAAGRRIAILNAPAGYDDVLGPLPDGVESGRLISGSFDLVQYFATGVAELDTKFPRLRDAVVQNGMVWVSWPKRAAKVETDLDENMVREIGLRHGMVDVKVIAVDLVWSGLKFVRRVRDRR